MDGTVIIGNCLKITVPGFSIWLSLAHKQGRVGPGSVPEGSSQRGASRRSTPVVGSSQAVTPSCKPLTATLDWGSAHWTARPQESEAGESRGLCEPRRTPVCRSETALGFGSPLHHVSESLAACASLPGPRAVPYIGSGDSNSGPHTCAASGLFPN